MSRQRSSPLQLDGHVRPNFFSRPSTFYPGYQPGSWHPRQIKIVTKSIHPSRNTIFKRLRRFFRYILVDVNEHSRLDRDRISKRLYDNDFELQRKIVEQNVKINKRTPRYITISV